VSYRLVRRTGHRPPQQYTEVLQMTLMRRPSPFGELLSLRQAMDRLFEDSFVRPRFGATGEGETNAIPLDIYATPDTLVLEAALPGVKPEDVEINVLGDTLTISGSTRHEDRREESGFLYQEVRRGTFSRTVTLPGDLKTDAATATFEHGMLRLSFPKAEAAKPRQIRIAANSEQTSQDRSSEWSRDAAREAQPVAAAAGSEVNGTSGSHVGA
jgi:HSP20 family protein